MRRSADHHLFLGWPPTDRLVRWRGLSDPLAHWARITPDAVFLDAPQSGEVVTYRQALASVEATASELCATRGFKAGDRVALVTSNSVSCVILILAVLRAGGRCVMVNPTAAPARVSAQVAAARPDLIVLGQPDGWSDRAAINVDELVRRADDWPVATDELQHDLDAAALNFYTTGSTAVAKSVAQSAYAVLLNVTAVARHLELGPGRRLVGVLPICFANGLQLSVLAPLVSGATCVLLSGFQPLTYLGDVASARGHIASLVPTMLDAVTRARRPPALDELDYFVTAAAPLSRMTALRTWDRLGKRIVQGYGLSETTNFSTMMPTRLSDADYRRYMFESDPPPVGIALLGNEVAILDEHDCLAPLGVVGEVCMRGHSVMLGYEANPTETAVALRAGWFHSGDLGRLDHAPAAGRPILTLTGRLKNITKVGGIAVSLEEIERLVAQLPGVADVGCAREPHRYLGESIRVDVVSGAPDPVDDDVRAAIGSVLAIHPDAIRICHVARILRTSNGKIVRHDIAPEPLQEST